MIEGVHITSLRQISDDRGKVMHMLRADSELFIEFGEIYFSCVNPGAIKAWKLHNEMTLNCAVPHGQVKFVLYDTRQSSITYGQIQEIIMGPANYVLVTVPPLIWTGLICIGNEVAILANCASIPHAPDESKHLDFDDPYFPYKWEVSHQWQKKY